MWAPQISKVVAIGADGQMLAPSRRRRQTQVSALGEEYDALEVWNVTANLNRRVVDAIAAGTRSPALPLRAWANRVFCWTQTTSRWRPLSCGNDKRTVPWVDWWRARLADAELYGIAGLPLRHIYSASKLLWHRQQMPREFARARVWLGLADWVTCQLTGRHSMSYSMASRTMLFDVSQRAWSKELLRLADLRRI